MGVRGRAVALETGAEPSSAWGTTYPRQQAQTLAAIVAELGTAAR